MTQQVPTHVFISYSRQDEKVMRQVAERLRGHGFIVWVDNEKLTPGTPVWEREVEKALRTASGVVVLLSPEAKNSTWVSREITLADEKQKFIVPILIRGDKDSSVPFRLVNHQYIDLSRNVKSGLDDLVDALSNVLGDTIFQTENKTGQVNSTAQEAPVRPVQDARLNAILEEIDRKTAARTAREKAEANRSSKGSPRFEPSRAAVPAAPKKSRAGWFLLAVLFLFVTPILGIAMGDQSGISALVGGVLFILILIRGSKSK